MPQDRLRGIQVASSISGIVGLRFKLENVADYASWKTAGIVENPPDGVGVATLEPRAGFQVSGAIIGLDVCKFVSIQLLESRLEPITTEDNSISRATAIPWLWHPIEPDSPENKPISLYPPERQQTTIEPTFALNMDFGGPSGTQLSFLNRVVAFHDDLRGSFRGFAFFYTDGHKKMFGTREIIDTASKRWTCTEQSIALDGPGGERIMNLKFEREQAARGNSLRVIKMVTNHGRVMGFQRWDRYSNASKAENKRSLAPPDREIITGILATVQLPTGSLKSLGVRGLLDVLGANTGSPSSLPHSHTQDLRSFPIDEARLKKAPRVLQNSSSCFTSVKLANVRRIGLSTGISGRTRGPDHVSGLCFEFWDSNVPLYLGQWFHEVSHLQVEPGERITGFTFWQTQESNPANTQRENSGRITGIRIDKTGLDHQTVEFCLGNKNDMLVYSFTENPYEELEGLAWSFSHDCDYIHVLTRPPKPHLGTVLVLHNILDFWPNSRIPDKLFWEVQDHEANWLNVSQIHAIFTEEKSLSGFIFEYGSAEVRRHAGYVQGEASSMGLEDDERVIRMDVSIGQSEDEVIFHTSVGRVCALAASSANSEPRDRQSSDFDVFVFNVHHNSESDDSPASRGVLTETSQTAGAEEECVGIWVTMKIFPRAMKIVEAVGPILTKKSEEAKTKEMNQETSAT
ncbi:hypothetical protein QQZ08_001871 [Neonectria magnoliae]|uniref:Uncharacterized protein n=1 Tax=Neonectria magnoliae TaxID=2732573 RepID=A0ABR1IDF6_9HYPO